MRPTLGRARLAASSWIVHHVLVPFLVTRGLLLTVALLALALLPRDPDPRKWEFSSVPWVNALARWDSGWYLTIAQRGYQFEPGRESNIAFFPLYPLLMRAVSLAVGADTPEGFLVVGIVVSNVALLIAIGYLVALVRLDFEPAVAGRAAFYLLVFPSSFYLSAVYADVLFLGLATASFYHARRESWWIAGMLGTAAALSRPQGVCLVVPLALEYVIQRRPHRYAPRPDALALGLVPLGLASYLLYLDWLTGTPSTYLQVQQIWGRRLMPPWEAFRLFFEAPIVVHGPPSSLMDLAFAIVFLILAIASWRLVRSSYALFVTTFLLVIISSGRFEGLIRYGVTLFPIFIVLALAGRYPAFDRTYVSVASGLGGLFMAMFALWYWVA